MTVRNLKTGVLLLLFTLITSCSMTSPLVPLHQPTAKNVILLIGDGMGKEQVRAASIYGFGTAGQLSFEDLPYQASVLTDTADGLVTDSGAAITAMVTGQKVNYRVLSRAIPGDGADLETILESVQEMGWATGVVTTTYYSHATPAGLMAHADDREDYGNIARQILETMPTVLLGAAKHIQGPDAEAAGYEVVNNRDEMLALPIIPDFPVFGLFGVDHMPYVFDGLGDYPKLWEMTDTAIKLLSQDPDGFFLMVEGGKIDLACHDADLERAIWETLAFSQAVEVALRFANEHLDETIVIVTADHETGGLEIQTDNGKGQLPTVVWTTALDNGRTTHSGKPVPYYGLGVGADPFSLQIDNTEIYDLMWGAVVGDY
jgi:alkaline phosphatase